MRRSIIALASVLCTSAAGLAIAAAQDTGGAHPQLGTWGVDLTAMEQVAQTAAAGLNQSTLEILLHQQAQRLGAQQPCPDCGLLCPVGFEDRPLAVQGGGITYHEPVCSCPDCRRDFFPPPGFLTTG